MSIREWKTTKDCYLKGDFGVSDLCNKIMSSKNLRSVYVCAEEFEDL